ncbi:MAG: YdcF family protein [Ruminococcus sp.]|nr:YdcF family protein [Ruminococcus sp.]
MTVKIILAVLECILCGVFLIALPVVNLGNIAGVGVSLILLFVTLKTSTVSALISKISKTVIGKISLVLIGIIIAVLLTLAVVLSVRMISAMDKECEEPSAVVVLGCQVKGERPSRMLGRRLDAAIGYLDSHPEIPVIVSGGQGWDEAISEALCMKNYLVEQGIAEDRIIMEDKSTSTDENLEFSFAILDGMGLSRNIVLVTDGYHQYRASLIAERHGVGNLGAVSASTEFRYLPTYWVREWFGLFQEMVLK